MLADLFNKFMTMDQATGTLFFQGYRISVFQTKVVERGRDPGITR